MEFLYAADRAVFLLINATLAHPALDSVMVLVTNLKFWIVPGVIAAVVFVFREDKKRAFTVLGLMVLTVALCDPLSSQVLKKLFARPRPCNPEAYVEGGRFLLGMYKSLSFPSSHSMNMFSLATLLFCFYRRQGVYFFSFAAMIAYSRVYCGVHYPSDVLGGAAFGSLLGWGVYAGYRFVGGRLRSASTARSRSSS